MSAEKLVRFSGLLLFFLFPLLSILQLRDSDAPWRAVADDVREAILPIVAGDASDPGGVVACGLVVQSAPLRVVVAHPLESHIGSYVQGAWVAWTPIYTDSRAGFSILQAAGEMDAETVGAGAHAHASVARARFQLDEESRQHDGIQVALVGPVELSAEPIWVGVLSSMPGLGGRALYHADLLRAVSTAGALPTSLANAEEFPEIDARLRGAPFVNARGDVVALYVGRSADGIVGLPIETVCGALGMLHLQAAN